MRSLLVAALFLACPALALPTLAQTGPDAVTEGTETFSTKVLAEGLQGPWELTWGPDNALWVTERMTGRVTRIDPRDGTKTEAIKVEEVVALSSQDGLMGMALGPGLLQGGGEDHVYLAYTYLAEGAGPAGLRTKIARFAFDPETETLGDPVDLITGLPASNDHNSGRLKWGPDNKLYYAIGDQGNNQHGRACLPIEAQRLPTRQEIAAEDWSAYVGKVLRLDPDGGIPEDNPEIEGVRSHVFTYGHRNPQGLAFAPDGALYATEHGPKADDELNLLRSGMNYGWPHVAGFQDGMAYRYARLAEASTPCESLGFSDIELHPSVPTAAETDWQAGNFIPPLQAFFTVPDGYNFQDPACGGVDFICWPTIAPSSLEVYAPDGPGIPGWERSLLIPTLKRGSLYRVSLTDDGEAVTGEVVRYFQSENRFRDIAVSPDGLTIYVATDPSGMAEGADGGTTTMLENPGAILAFTFGGEQTDDVASQASVGACLGEPDTAPEIAKVSAEQAARGRAGYREHCAVCHGSSLSNGTYGPPLAGPYFAARCTGHPVWDLYQYTHDRMPPAAPASLPDQTYAEIVSFILEVNGHGAGGAELGSDETQLRGLSISPAAQ